MCDARAPQSFIRVKYRHACFNCKHDEAFFLLIAKCGPLPSANSVRGSHFIPVTSLKCIDEWEIELKLKEQEVGPVELGEFDDHWVPDFALCGAREWESGVLDVDQLKTSRLMFAELNRQLAVLGL